MGCPDNPVGMLVLCQGRKALDIMGMLPELCRSDSLPSPFKGIVAAFVLTGLKPHGVIYQGLAALAMNSRPYGTSEPALVNKVAKHCSLATTQNVTIRKNHFMGNVETYKAIVRELIDEIAQIGAKPESPV